MQQPLKFLAQFAGAALLGTALACGGGGSSAPVGPTSGSLTVTLAGVPGGAAASVQVTGPGAFNQSVTATQTLSNLTPGNYNLAASPLVTGGTDYPASPAAATVAVAAGATSATTVTYAADPRFVYVANSNAASLSVFKMDAGTGSLVSLGAEVATGAQPLGVVAHPNGKYLYVPCRNSSDIWTYTIGSGGGLTPLGSPLSQPGMGFSHMVVSPDGKFAFSANYANHSVSSYAINPTTGALTPTGSPVLAGGNAAWTLAVDPGGKFLYSCNYGAGTVSHYTINGSTGQLTLQGTPIAAGGSAWGIAMHPNGKFLFVSAYATHTVYVYSIDAVTGALSLASSLDAGASGSELMTLDPTGKWLYLANYGSSTISMFAVNAATGALTALAGSPLAVAGGPAGIVVDQRSRFAYVTLYNSAQAGVFRIDSATGVLTPYGAPVAAGAYPWMLAFR